MLQIWNTESLGKSLSSEHRKGEFLAKHRGHLVTGHRRTERKIWKTRERILVDINHAPTRTDSNPPPYMSLARTCIHVYAHKADKHTHTHIPNPS